MRKWSHLWNKAQGSGPTRARGWPAAGFYPMKQSFYLSRLFRNHLPVRAVLCASVADISQSTALLEHAGEAAPKVHAKGLFLGLALSNSNRELPTALMGLFGRQVVHSLLSPAAAAVGFPLEDRKLATQREITQAWGASVSSASYPPCRKQDQAAAAMSPLQLLLCKDASIAATCL